MDSALVEDIKADFAKIDKNGDGSIEHHEFTYHFAKFNLDLDFAKLDELFRRLDVNGDGKISWEEYLGYMYKKVGEYKDKFLNPVLVEDIRADFKQIDKNGDGMLELQELAYHFAKFNDDADFEKLELMFKKLDTNGDGKISWEEYLNYMYKKITDYRAKSTPVLFKRLDKDGDGQITAAEVQECSFKAFGFQMTEDEARTFFAKVDVNNDGKISFEEFKLFLEH